MTPKGAAHAGRRQSPGLADFPEGGFGLTITRQGSDAVGDRHDLGLTTVRLVPRREPATA